MIGVAAAGIGYGAYRVSRLWRRRQFGKVNVEILRGGPGRAGKIEDQPRRTSISDVPRDL